MLIFRLGSGGRRRSAAGLREPHIIPIHDYGEIDGQLFIDMRLVEGVDLGSVLDQFGPLHPLRAVEIVSQIASALAAAHAEGLVHRDIKPSNVLLAGGGPDQDYIYLIDFGIAHTSNTTSLTAAGTTIGTLDYMAPERMLHGSCDQRADIYALGGVLHTILTATTPFPGDGPAQMYAHIHTPPPAPSQHRPELPVGLDAVVATAMAKNSDHRYRTTNDLAGAARAALKTPTRTTTARPTNPGIPTRRLEEPSHSPGMPAARPPDAALTRTPPRDRPWIQRRRVLVIALVIAALAGLGAVLVTSHQQPAQQPGITPTAGATPRFAATIPVGTYPVRVAVVPDGRRAYISNAGAGTVSVIDTTSNTVTATIPVGAGPNGVAVAPDGRHAYTVNFGPNSVSVIDLATNTVTATVPVGGGPYGVAVLPDGRYAYIASRSSNAVSVIDLATNTVTATIPVGISPWAVSVTPDGRHAYIPNNGANTVSVMDTATNTVTATILVGLGPTDVAITPDGRRAYTTNAGAGTVSVIDTATNTVTATIPDGTNPTWVALTPDGGHAYTTNFAQGTVSVIDLATNTVTATIPVGENACGVAVTPDGRHAYITNFGAGTVSVIDTGSG
jgi:serine/threonine-protein kinase